MHKFFATWGDSILAAFSGGHFHLTAGLVGLGVVVIPVVFLMGRSAARSFGSPSGGEFGAFLLVVGSLIAGGVYLAEQKPARPAPIAAAPRPTTIIHRTTIVQHITNLPGHPILSGWQLVAVVIAVVVVGLVMFINLIRRSN